MHLIEDFAPDQVAVFGGDHIYRMDLRQMVDFHMEKGAIATIAAIPVPVQEAHQFGIIEVDEDWRIVGFQEKPENPKTLPNDSTMCLASMGNYIFEADHLLNLLKSDHASKDSSHDFGKDIIPSLVETKRLYAYNFYDNKIPGQTVKDKPYWRDVGTLKAFFEANMDLRATKPQLDLYNTKWPIYNYHFSLPPAKFVHNEEVDKHGLPRIGKAINSIVCDGCIVSGSVVTNSVLFNQVFVHSYATVHNCILLNDVLPSCMATPLQSRRQTPSLQRYIRCRVARLSTLRIMQVQLLYSRREKACLSGPKSGFDPDSFAYEMERIADWYKVTGNKVPLWTYHCVVFNNSQPHLVEYYPAMLQKYISRRQPPSEHPPRRWTAYRHRRRTS